MDAGSLFIFLLFRQVPANAHRPHHCSGALYSWGRGDRGQLGQGDRESYTQAIRVCGGSPTPLLGAAVVSVCAGVSQSVVVTADGGLWVWGKMQVRGRREPSHR